MTKQEMLREIERLERIKPRSEFIRRTVTRRIEAIRYNLKHPIRMALRRNLSKFFEWLSIKVLEL